MAKLYDTSNTGPIAAIESREEAMKDAVSSIRFALVDVFADLPLTGNPLAVVPDSDALTVDQMRRIAGEFNQSETTFLLRPSSRLADHRLRSFTASGAEVLGAGHNALGAWLWLADAGRLDPHPAGWWTQEIGSDTLPVRIARGADDRYSITMTQTPPIFVPPLTDLTDLAHALGLTTADLTPSLPIQVVDTGAAHLLVAVTDAGTVDRVAVNPGELREVLRRAGGEGCYVYSTLSAGDIDAYARFFNPTMGIVEDPATGTAAGPLAAALARHRRVPSTRIVIVQGQVMGRPSRMHVDIDEDTVQLSGSGLIVGTGTLSL